MQKGDIDAVYVAGAHGKTKDKIYGIVTRENIERNQKEIH